MSPHPHADKLRIAQVDIGENSHRQIICGAANAKEGITAAVALPDSILAKRNCAARNSRRRLRWNALLRSRIGNGGIRRRHFNFGRLIAPANRFGKIRIGRPSDGNCCLAKSGRLFESSWESPAKLRRTESRCCFRRRLTRRLWTKNFRLKFPRRRCMTVRDSARLSFAN